MSCTEIPVFALTSTSRYFASSRSLESIVPIQPPKKPSGTEISAGFVNIINGSPTKIALPATGFQIFGDTATNAKAEIKPVNIAVTAPAVLNLFQ